MEDVGLGVGGDGVDRSNELRNASTSWDVVVMFVWFEL